MSVDVHGCLRLRFPVSQYTLSQLQPGAVQVNFHLAFIQPGDLPDLGIIIAFIVFQHHQAPLGFAEAAQGFIKDPFGIRTLTGTAALRIRKSSFRLIRLLLRIWSIIWLYAIVNR